MLRDRRKTPRQVVGELKAQFGKTATSRTVRNVLKKYGLRHCVAVRRPLLTKKMRLARLQWAREHCNWSVDKWKGVVFTDEKSFRLGNNSRGVYVTRLPSEEFADS